MAVRASIYSSLIAGLKVVLPLAALGLLSILFLLSRSITPDPDVHFIDDVSEIPTSDSISGPYYSGSTPEGHGVLITASSARPMANDPEGFVAEKLDATFKLTDGSTIHVVANQAEVNEPMDHLGLTGDVVVDSSNGYVVRTQALVSALRSVAAHTPGIVEATGPAGDLTAGQFSIKQGVDSSDVQMLFTNGVKLIYEPAKQESKEP